MTDRRYDAIVVGARCAGSPTAMLLAGKGYRVLLVDRAHFPSDTVSTHLIHAPGVAALDRWGLLDRLGATGCPPVTTYSFDFGPLTITGTPQAAGDTAVAYCPRRTVLDKLLIDAASEAGAEVREGFTLNELVFEDDIVVGIRGRTSGGSSVVERARVVIGADGAHSRVAHDVGADRYHRKPVLAVAYYSYWSGIPVADAGWAIRPRRGYGAFPTNDRLTMLLAAWPYTEFQKVKQDIESNYLQALRLVFGDRFDGARREERVVGGRVANQFRTPYGPGWVLVGDAGYLKDPVTAQGITDAFHDAELCAAALEQSFSGTRSFDDAMADYQRRRDARVLPIYEFTAQIASLEPPPPELQQLLAAVAGNPAAMDEFASVFAGTVSPAAFFDPGHIGRLVSSPA
jgi:flavin-dependent dehydrogenase